MHPVERNTHLPAFQDILDVAVLRGFLYRTLNQRLGTTQEPLTVFKAFAAWIQAPVDDVHSHCCIASASLLHAHIPFDEPANLTLGITAPHHPRDKLAVLLFGVAVLLG